MKTHQVSEQLLIDCRALLVTLTKNVAHCYGIDFRALNESMIELDRILPKDGEPDTGRGTPTSHTEEQFAAALEGYLGVCRKLSDERYDRLSLPKPTFEVQRGQKYLRVVGGHGVHSFINIATGDILKPESWKKPAKHARGNIFDADFGEAHQEWHGPRYLR